MKPTEATVIESAITDLDKAIIAQKTHLMVLYTAADKMKQKEFLTSNLRLVIIALEEGIERLDKLLFEIERT